MEEFITIDFNKSVLDVTNKAVEVLDPEIDAEQVLALVLTHNPIKSMGFLVRFPNIQMLHADSLFIDSLASLPLDALRKL